MADHPDYYKILEVAPTATSDEIKRAYKKAALKWHPDRVPADSPERPKRTKKFQAINDAYYTLSEPSRRREYDDARRWHTGATFTDDDAEEIPHQPQPGWGSFFGFGGKKDGTQEEKFANDQFEDVFEEMMGEASMQDENTENQDPRSGGKKTPFWSVLGGLSGATMGYIIANFPGAATGAAAGAKLGRLRDEKGQSVYTTFQQLPQGDRAKLLTELATRLFAGAIS